LNKDQNKTKLTVEEQKVLREQKAKETKERLDNLWNQNKTFVEVKRIVAILVSTIIYGIGLSWFINGIDREIFTQVASPDGGFSTVSNTITIYTGGVAGIGQVVYDLFNTVFGIPFGGLKLGSVNIDGRDLFLSLFVFFGNVPLFVLGWFGVSKKFTIYSIISVVTQSLLIGFIPRVPTGLSQEPFISAVIGGMLIGVGTGIALRFGTSTGGLDIVAQYLSLRKGISFGMISLLINLAICLSGGIILGSLAVISYTIIRLIVGTIMTDKIHTGYNYQAINIITKHKEEVVELILHKIYRGVTLVNVVGAYTKEEKTMIYVVISSYELHNLLNALRKVDKDAFVTATPVKNIYGAFARKTIA
jgi:uncharacterized membrane-anchored protein YitT (DUF2179 family)